MKKLVIAIDFDGTIVTDKYPDIGYLKRNANRKPLIICIVGNG